MSNAKRPARNRHELIIQAWEEMDCESVGVAELEQIQRVIAETFGTGAVDSPAAIARQLADEGAVLRHPEVLDADTDWRDKRLFEHNELDFLSLQGALAAIRKLEAQRVAYVNEGDESLLKELVSFIAEVQDELAFVVHSKTIGPGTRAEVNEVLGWLAIWRQTPDLFNDWLELRLASSEFRERHHNFVARQETTEQITADQAD
jgi:hypothetical protein